jgi:type I restriction-modification system DNA methylase subunit
MRNPERNPNARSLSARDLDKLQKATFYGLENKPLTYLLGTMNMILHGIEGANMTVCLIFICLY